VLRAVNKPRRSTSIRSNLTVLAVTVLVLLVGAELVLRVTYRPEIVGSVIRYDPVLGWSLRPGASVWSDMPERGTRIRIRVNSLGLRDHEVQAARTPGRRRILIIGDSIAFGSGLDAGERFSDQLARELGDRVEVINAGVPGWGNDQELLFYERTLRALHPDVVILTFTMNNDIVNNALQGAILEGGTKPYFTLAGDSLVMHPPAPPARQSVMVRTRNVLRRSRLLVFVRRRLKRVAYRHQVHEEAIHEYHGFESYRHLSHWSVYESPPGDAVEDAWKVTEAIIERLASDCRRDSCRLIVFAVPLKLEVDSGWRSSLVEKTGADATHLDMMLPYRRLSAFCEARGIEFQYPLDSFRAAAAEQPLFFQHDSHPNMAGNAVAARYLRRVISETPPGPPEGSTHSAPR